MAAAALRSNQEFAAHERDDLAMRRAFEPRDFVEMLAGSRWISPMFATITVTTTNDTVNVDSQCSLREAIMAANSNTAVDSCTAGTAGLDTIQFSLGAGTPTINVTSALPTITEPVTINGNTGGATRIELNGSAAGAAANGLTITAGGSTIQRLVINRFSGGAGIRLQGGMGNAVQNCFVGTSAAGTAALPNNEGIRIEGSSGNTLTTNVISGNMQSGVAINNATATGNQILDSRIGVDPTGLILPNGASGITITGAPGNTIGNTGPRNVISGNGQHGISITNSNGTQIIGNFIGLDTDGAGALGNLMSGVAINNSANTIIGGTAANAGNTISGNGNHGVQITGASSTGNILEGNRIGVDDIAMNAVPNTQDGVNINGAPGNTIGGVAAASRNIISGNGDDGVDINGVASGNQVRGNYIGVDTVGTTGIANTASGVQILNSPNNTVGAALAGAGNVISGNGVTNVLISGVSATGNQVQGNLIGLDATGTMPLSTNDGVTISDAPSNTIGGTTSAARNTISGHLRFGINIFGATATGNSVQGNFIGLNSAGTAAIANTSAGVAVSDTTSTTIGGTAAGAGNVISGNGTGIDIFSGSGTQIQGNLIGTNPAGTAAIGNGFEGINIRNSSGNIIGGTTAAARNLASGNGQFGINVTSLGTGGNTIQGNFIGTNATGTAGIGNGAGGVLLAASTNTLGGTASGAGNLISGNANRGVLVGGPAATGNQVEGNFIGLNTAGTAALGNSTNGVEIINALNNTIGGTTTSARNIISGNLSNGVRIESTGLPTTGNQVQGNFIGLNAAGSARIANQNNGVLIFDASNNFIGGTATGAGNVISGNENFGIGIANSAATGNQIQGNLIGTNPAGTAAIGNRNSGVDISSANNNTIGGTATGARNVISGNGSDASGGITLGNGASGNQVLGNFIGTDITGMAGVSNSMFGVRISNSSTNNIIGGTTAAARNIISGNNGHGVRIQDATTTGNQVLGNYIGTNVAGTAALGNTNRGVSIENSPNNTVGGTAAGAGNLVSGNGDDGIAVEGTTANGNTVQGNFVGVNALGTAALPNVDNGIAILSANNCVVGGTAAGAGNLVSGNGDDGIEFSGVGGGNNNLAQGNRVGVDAAGTGALGNVVDGVHIFDDASGNTVGGALAGAGNIIANNGNYGIRIDSPTAFNNAILGNAIFGNLQLGIDLGGDGLTPNDAGDPDAGPNNVQNFPVLTSVFSTGAISGAVDSLVANSAYPVRIEFFGNATCDPSGNGEGEVFLGSTTIAAPGNFTAMVTLVMGKNFITATATDNNGNTSEFSACLKANAAPTIESLLTSRQQGSPATNSQIAIVSDPDQAPSGLMVTATPLTGTGVTISNIMVGPGGEVTADVAASCTATTSTFMLTVTDFAGEMATATLTVNVAANAPPAIGTYPTTSIPTVGGGAMVTPSTPPTDNGAISSVVATAPGFTGTLMGNTTTGVITITNASPAGTFTVTVTVTDNCGATVQSMFMLTVNKIDTLTTITSDNPDPSVVGQTVTVNFTVASNPSGMGTPTGMVTITVSGGVETCTGTLAAGTGSCTLALTSAGNRTLTATYSGDANFNGSPDTEAHTVNASATTTTVTDMPDPTVTGEPVTANFTVTATSPGSGTPTGTVTVSDGVNSCMGTLVAGSGSCSLTIFTVGTPTLTATYSGNANFNASSGATTHTVNKANTTAAIISDAPDPSVVGQNVTVNFAVSVTPPGNGTPTGNVIVSDGVNSCTGTVAAGQCVIALFTPGVRTLTATYQGDANYNASPASPGAGHQVNKADTTTTITADNPDPSVFGQTITVNFTVVATAPGAGTPTGNVVITASGGAETCTGTIAAGSCTLALTTVGNRTLTATYAGDASYNGSSDTEAHTVNKADTLTTITSDNPDSSAVGQNVVVNFTVAAVAPGVGTPTGTVTITASGGSETCTGTLAAGSGTCTLALTVPGSRTLTATYNGDTNFNTSTDTEPHVVVAPPVIAKSFNPTAVPLNGVSTLTLSITNPAANTAPLTGVGVVDNFLPTAPGMVVHTTPGVTNTCATGVFNPVSGDTTLTISGATIPVGTTCNFTVQVRGTISGPQVNNTGNVTSTNGGTGNSTSATLQVNVPPVLTPANLSQAAGSTTLTTTIATATDLEDPEDQLVVQISTDGVNFFNSVTTGNVTVTLNDQNGGAAGVNPTVAGAVIATIVTPCNATVGPLNLTLRATDTGGQMDTKPWMLTITPNPPPTLSYGTQMVMAGATPSFGPATGPSDNGTLLPITLQSVTPNTGLMLSVHPTTGIVSVTSPAQAGSYNVVISVTDNCNITTSASFTVNVVCPAITVNPPTLPSGTTGTGYSQMVSASPAGTYNFTVSSGALPNGVSLNASTGAITGTPSQSGTFNFTITATDANGCTGNRAYTLTVACPPFPITINAPSAVSDGQNLSYDVSVTSACPDVPLNTTLTTSTPPNTTFQSITAPNDWTCTTPPVGGTGAITCTNNTFAPRPNSPNRPQATANFNIVLRVNPGTPNGTVITNNITVTGTAPGRPTVTAMASSSTTVGNQADVVLTKSGPVTAISGTTFNYTFNLVNVGPGNADNITFTDTLPAGVVFVSNTTPAGFTCSQANGTVTCTAPTLANGASANFSITARLNADVASNTIITNSATATSSITDPNTTNNTSSVPTTAQTQSDLAVNVTAPATATPDTSATYTVTVTNNGPSSSFNTSLNNALPAAFSAETITTSAGTCTGAGTNSVNCNLGTLAVGATATVTIQAHVPETCQPTTAVFTATVMSGNSLTDPVAGNNSQSKTTTVLLGNVGAGACVPAASAISTDKPGSVLFAGLAVSGATAGGGGDSNQNNTRMNLTNVHPTLNVVVHLFFIDGATCSVADSFICLTANQTTSFLMSDLDPGTMGYMMMIAVDGPPGFAGGNNTGCPISFNYLIGNANIKFTGSPRRDADLASESASGLFGSPVPTCDPNSSVAELHFDGSPTGYNRLPQVLALDNIGSRADGNDTILMLGRVDGNWATGLQPIGPVFGLLYNDTETAISFTFNAGTCLFRSPTSNNFPRTSPRFEQFIPAGRTGWLKVWAANDVALVGAAFNRNDNAQTSGSAFEGGHNLHILRLLPSAVITVPVFPPSC